MLTASTTVPTTVFSGTSTLYRSCGKRGWYSLTSVRLTTTVATSLREEEPFRLHSTDRKYLGLVSKSRLLLTYRIPKETRGGGSSEAVGPQVEAEGSQAKPQRGHVSACVHVCVPL